ncbi:hypothetical protein ACQPZF_03495 [Actinosynnema sp. CS-041913]|uniref:hypothetical protein n=1 Tax=Actinosynnema sp. CS-041913 TaxID=3239917 RepID=UPI003D8BC8F7
MGSLWIGPPGRLREIRDAATEFDRSVSLGVQEFASLSGGVTVTRLATPPRRMSLSWTNLRPEDARWLEALARRVHGPRPLAVLDPASDNLVEPNQSLGIAPTTGVSLVGFGILAEQPDGTLTVTGTQDTSRLHYGHTHWVGWPVVPGVVVSFTTALAQGNGAACELEFYDRDGTLIESAGPTAPLLSVLPPPGAVFVFPKVRLPALSVPTPVGGALLRLGGPVAVGEPVPLGDGCPAMAVTGYTDRPRLAHRDMTLTLVEVRHARS